MQSTPTTYNRIAKDVNKRICEALECSENATDEIKLDVGQFGKISLYLCKNCLPKFKVK